jgi:hypothetical protein
MMLIIMKIVMIIIMMLIMIIMMIMMIIMMITINNMCIIYIIYIYRCGYVTLTPGFTTQRSRIYLARLILQLEAKPR